MHYYTKNIADFNNATRHLTRQERSIYHDLLELQYDIETPIPDDIDWVCRKILARDEQERTDVERMLNEFFDHLEEGWSNARCESEIDAFRSKRDKAIQAGKASGAARRRNKKPIKNKALEHNRTDVERTLNVSATNVELTNNHKPITKESESKESPHVKTNKSKTKTLRTYITECKQNGVDPIPVDSIALTNAHSMGLTNEVIDVCWFQFKNFWLEQKPKSGKSNWVSAFNECLKGGGYGCYAKNANDELYLTTKGKNALKIMESENG